MLRKQCFGLPEAVLRHFDFRRWRAHAAASVANWFIAYVKRPVYRRQARRIPRMDADPGPNCRAGPCDLGRAVFHEGMPVLHRVDGRPWMLEGTKRGLSSPLLRK